MLELRSIHHCYGKLAVLKDFNHVFEPGVTVLTGPSGAGKSTLLRLCATADKPRKGTLHWNGEPIRGRLKSIRKDLGYAPQVVELPEDLTGLEFLRHMAALKGLAPSLKAQPEAILNDLGLGAAKDQRIVGYSGGMRRRLILAQALLGTPSLLALDEPTAELDSETAGRVAELINHRAENAVVIMTTHLPEAFIAAGSRNIHIDDSSVTVR